MPIPPPESGHVSPSKDPGSQRAPADRGPERFEPIAGLLAILLPGLGHFYLGERARAGLIASGVLGLFTGGVMIGGIDAIDSREDTIWFVGQALVGPLAFGVDYIHQNHVKIREPVGAHEALRLGVPPGTVARRSARPNEARDPQTALPAAQGPGIRPPNSKSLGRMNELGTLFATIAGMLNLIVIIDAFYRASPAGRRA